MESQAGSNALTSGKIPLDLLRRLLAGFPAPPPELRLGAAIGEDACAIDVPAGTLVVAADPITLTSSQVGRLAVIVNANDVAVTGARPTWFLAVILVPPGTTESAVGEVFAGVQGALAEIGAHLVGGHTEVTSAVTQPVVVGQMLGLASSETLVTTGGMDPGDVLIQVMPAPIEGAAVLAREAHGRLQELDPDLLAAAESALDRPGISVVQPALLATQLAAKALHDPTEGGLAGGLHEMAEASGTRLTVLPEAVLWFEPGVAACRALGLDPWATLASGTLLAAFDPGRASDALSALAAGGYEASIIGTAGPGAGVFDTAGRAIAWPDRDEVARVVAGTEERAAPDTI